MNLLFWLLVRHNEEYQVRSGESYHNIVSPACLPLIIENKNYQSHTRSLLNNIHDFSFLILFIHLCCVRFFKRTWSKTACQLVGQCPKSLTLSSKSSKELKYRRVLFLSFLSFWPHCSIFKMVGQVFRYFFLRYRLERESVFSIKFDPNY